MNRRPMKREREMRKIVVSLLLALCVIGGTALAEAPAEGELYAGIDPWGNPLSVTLISENTLSGTWSQNFDGDLFTQAFSDARDGFGLEGPLGDSDYISCRYTGSMVLDGDRLIVTFTDGEMTTASTEGGSTSHHVAPLGETERIVTLVPAVRSDYSGVTTLSAAAVEAFAARVRQLYLDGDWDDMARLISYPVTMYPDTGINDEEAFVAFMADKTISESDMEAMTEEHCVGMMSNGEGICMGSGQIWIRDIAFDGVEQIDEPSLRVIALSGPES